MNQHHRLSKAVGILLSALIVASAGIPALTAGAAQTAVTADAIAAKASDFSYLVNSDGTITVTGLSSSVETAEIPSSIEGYTVTGIGRRAFAGCTQLTKVTIPATVTAMDEYAFAGCKSLASVQVRSGNSVFAAEGGVLYDHNKTKVIYCPPAKSGTVSLPKTVKTVRKEAFSGCTKITGITLPAVTEIGEEAFYGCRSLKSITLPQGVKTVPQGAFRDCGALEQAELPDSVTAVGDCAFYCCSRLRRVNIPAKTVSIGESAFDGCLVLSEISLPQGLKTIGDCGFSSCRALTEVTLPASLTTLGEDAFFDCRNLEKLWVESGNEKIYSYYGALIRKADRHVLLCPEGMEGICRLPEGATVIESHAFRNCRKLSAVVVPDSVTGIAKDAFVGSEQVLLCGSANGTAAKFAAAHEMAFEEGDLTLTNTSSISAELIEFGDSATVTCSAKNINGTCVYSVFYRFLNGRSWRCLQNSSTNRKVVFSPDAVGVYQVQVQARDDTGKLSNKTFVLTVGTELVNTSTISQQEIPFHKTATLQCSAEGGSHGYQYAVYYKTETAEKWSCARKYSPDSTVVFTPPEAGSLLVRVRVKDAAGKTAKKTFSLTVTEAYANTSRLSSSAIDKGKTVTVDCSARYGAGDYTFAVYYRKTGSTGWNCAQEYAENTAVTIQPKYAATYDIRVKAKDSKGKVAVKNLTLEVKPVLTNTSKLSASAISHGKTVRVTCSAKNGTGDYTYAVYYKKSERTGWACAQEYAANTAVTIQPKYAAVYDIRVKAKDSKGKVAVKDLTLEVKPVLTNTSKLSASAISHGKTVRVTCSAKNGTGDYTFAVYYRKTGSTGWACAQEYAENTAVTIQPKYAATYDIRVKVKDSKGKVAVKDLTLEVKPVLTNTSRLSASAISHGKTVKVTCSAKNGAGDYTFAVYYRKTGSTGWACAQEYAENTAVTIQPKYAATYDIRVKAKDSKGKVAAKDLTLEVKPVLTNTSKLSAASISHGKTVKVTCSAKNGTGDYTFAVYYRKTGSTGWACAQEYAENTAVTIQPKYAATYDIRVKAKDSKGKVAVKDLTLEVKPVLTNTSKLSAASISHGKTVKVTCSAKNGAGDYTYAVYYKKSDRTGWNCAQEYAENTAVTIQPKYAATYDIRVKAKDSKGKVAVKDLTLEVTKSGDSAVPAEPSPSETD